MSSAIPAEGKNKGVNMPSKALLVDLQRERNDRMWSWIAQDVDIEEVLLCTFAIFQKRGGGISRVTLWWLGLPLSELTQNTAMKARVLSPISGCGAAASTKWPCPGIGVDSPAGLQIPRNLPWEGLDFLGTCHLLLSSHHSLWAVECLIAISSLYFV